jgi:hypothetical protein
MKIRKQLIILLCLSMLMFTFQNFTLIQSSGITDYGRVIPTVHPRGYGVTKNAQNEDVLLVWPFDGKGTNSIYMIRLSDGELKEFKVPFNNKANDGVFASLFYKDKFYTLFGGRFLVFDPKLNGTGGFSFVQQTKFSNGEYNGKKPGRQNARSLAVDPRGFVYAATYPDLTLVRFNTNNQKLRDYGPLTEQAGVPKSDTKIYPDSMEVDELGYVYIGVGRNSSKIVAFNPVGAIAQELPIAPEYLKGKGAPELCKLSNNVVYTHAPNCKFEPADGYGRFALMGGKAFSRYIADADKDPLVDTSPRFSLLPSPFEPIYRVYKSDGKIRYPDFNPGIYGVKGSWQDLKYNLLPDARSIKDVSFDTHRILLSDNSEIEMKGERTINGAKLMSVSVANDGSIIGGSFIPHRFYRLAPADFDSQGYFEDTFSSGNPQFFEYEAQANSVASSVHGNFIGGYSHGRLLKWDLGLNKESVQELTSGVRKELKLNNKNYEAILRPLRVLPHPTQPLVVMGGVPGYGLAGGALLFHTLGTDPSSDVMLIHKKLSNNDPSYTLVPEQSPTAIVWGRRNNKNVVVGATTALSATGVVDKNAKAHIFIVSPSSNYQVWKKDDLLGDVKTINDLLALNQRFVVGIADRTKLFIFDVEERKIVHTADLSVYGKSVSDANGTKVFVNAAGKIFLFFEERILQMNSQNYSVSIAKNMPSEVTINNGGAFSHNKLFFVSSGRLLSWRVP